MTNIPSYVSRIARSLSENRYGVKKNHNIISSAITSYGGRVLSAAAAYGSTLTRAYGTRIRGFAAYRKRRPKRFFSAKGCSYCGGKPKTKPLVAMAVNPTARPVDLKRLSAPCCAGCGKTVA